jgi:hypothetical protein
MDYHDMPFLFQPSVLSPYPFSCIVSGHQNVLIFSRFCSWFNWSHKVKTPFHKWFKCLNGLKWSFTASPHWCKLLAYITCLTCIDSIFI